MIYTIAELLHSTHCLLNHTDGCDWYYGEWDDKPLRYSKDRYLSWARALVNCSDLSETQIADLLELQYNTM